MLCYNKWKNISNNITRLSLFHCIIRMIQTILPVLQKLQNLIPMQKNFQALQPASHYCSDCLNNFHHIQCCPSAAIAGDSLMEERVRLYGKAESGFQPFFAVFALVMHNVMSGIFLYVCLWQTWKSVCFIYWSFFWEKCLKVFPLAGNQVSITLHPRRYFPWLS